MMVKFTNFIGQTYELSMAHALEPNSELLTAQAVGRLAALLVEKGVITFDEACKATMQTEKFELIQEQQPVSQANDPINGPLLTKMPKPMPSNFRIGVEESDGRTWVTIRSPSGKCATLSCLTNNANGRTIQSAVLEELRQALGD